MNTVPYLSIRHQRFYFRRSVPKNLRGFSVSGKLYDR